MKFKPETKHSKLLFSLLLSCIIGTTFSINDAKAAENLKPVIIDLYRTHQITADQIRNKFGEDIQKAVNLMFTTDLSKQSPESKSTLELLKKIVLGIRKMGHFSYVNLSPITYPDDKTIHVTVDIVDQKDKKRLHTFFPKPKKTLPDPDHLIEKELAYEKIEFNLMFHNKWPEKNRRCPAWHCLYGFDHPLLKPYESVFTTLAPKNKTQLMAILRKDKDPRRRAAAAFLLAYIKDGNELIKILTPSIYDPDQGVRNNVMRVLGETLFKLKTDNFPIKQIVNALDFPTTTDRNKAFMVITGLLRQPTYNHYLIQHAHQPLIDALKLSQPDLHDEAYVVLKKLSGKDFGERDYASWEQWLKSNKT